MHSVINMQQTHTKKVTQLACLPSHRQTILEGLSIGIMLVHPYAYACAATIFQSLCHTTHPEKVAIDGIMYSWME